MYYEALFADPESRLHTLFILKQMKERSEGTYTLTPKQTKEYNKLVEEFYQ